MYVYRNIVARSCNVYASSDIK